MGKSTAIAPSWRRAWPRKSSVLRLPPAVRKIIFYTTNAIESLTAVIEKPQKRAGSFPLCAADPKLIYLAIAF